MSAVVSPSVQARAPVFGWASLRGPGRDPVPEGILGLPHQVWTSSGRAALWNAFVLLGLPSGSGVLVPTYHCPTMIAPVVAQGLRPLFYALGDDGLPDLDRIDAATRAGATAMVVAHFFGRGQSLAAVRAWCDRHRLPLIEDCAHAPFGRAGERPVGHWGDLATASLSKFLPVPEAGLLASAVRPLDALRLQPAAAGRELRAWVEVIDRGPAQGHIGALLSRLRPPRPAPAAAPAADAAPACDLTRVGQRPTRIAHGLATRLPLAATIEARRAHFGLLRARLQGLAGCRPLWTAPVGDAAPYVFPLFVDAPDAVYAGLRAAGRAVLRWDIVWPGTPQRPGDAGAAWSRHVLQLLCHQSLTPADLGATADTLRALLPRP
jgi:perosamine synthetase